MLEHGELQLGSTTAPSPSGTTRLPFPIAPPTYPLILRASARRVGRASSPRTISTSSSYQSIITAFERLPPQDDARPGADRGARPRADRRQAPAGAARRSTSPRSATRSRQQSGLNGTPGDPRSVRRARRSCSRRSRTGSPSGGWRPRRSTTGASSRSTSWPRSGRKMPEVFDATHALLLSPARRGQRRPACGSTTRTGSGTRPATSAICSGPRSSPTPGRIDADDASGRRAGTSARPRGRTERYAGWPGGRATRPLYVVGREDPRARRSAAGRLGGRRHGRLRVRAGDHRALRRSREPRGVRRALRAVHRRPRPVRRPGLREEAADHAGRAGQRAQRAGAGARPPLGARPPHARLHASTACASRCARSSPASRSTAPTSTCEPGASTERDRRYIEQAVAQAKRRNPAIDRDVFDFLRDVLLLRRDRTLTPRTAGRAAAASSMKFQQLTGPVMAKGLEDTAFYIYNRLVSLNEVGGDPAAFGASVGEFHRQNAERAATLAARDAGHLHPRHQAQRGRARPDQRLSEMPREWRAALNRWARLNRQHKPRVDGDAAPGPQRRVPALPDAARRLAVRSDDAPDAAFVERIEAYMLKATREAKVHTSWINPNEATTARRATSSRAILDRRQNRRSSTTSRSSTRGSRAIGAFNALAQTLLKLTAPGVPDIYQGTELWDFSLVDPDNRRPSTTRQRTRALSALRRRKPSPRLGPGAARPVGRWPDQALPDPARARTARRQHPELFERWRLRRTAGSRIARGERRRVFHAAWDEESRSSSRRA